MEYSNYNNNNINLNKFKKQNEKYKLECDNINKKKYNLQLNTYKKTFNSKNYSKCNNQKVSDYIFNNNVDSCNLVYNNRVYPELTNNNCINQLFPRITKTNPNIFKGNVNKIVENIIISGVDTSQKKSTNTENINEVMPLNSNVENFIFNRNYDNDLSRKIISSRKYNKKKIN